MGGEEVSTFTHAVTQHCPLPAHAPKPMPITKSSFGASHRNVISLVCRILQYVLMTACQRCDPEFLRCTHEQLRREEVVFLAADQTA